MLDNWRRGEAGPDSTLGFPSASHSARISTYFAPLEDNRSGALLMFLEDSSLLAEKVRQTKLVALGRLSASIAHEIRNPVGALSHAGQLLQESPAIGAGEQRLLDIINVNSRRVSEIVENVMQLSRRDRTRAESIRLDKWTSDFVREFCSTLELHEGQVRIETNDESLAVRMDPSHLHQVCWNLCENALKYASEAAGGICVEISYGRMTGSRRPFLEVADRGPGIDSEMRERLFEPFATGRNGGTGLGPVYLARALRVQSRIAGVRRPRRRRQPFSHRFCRSSSLGTTHMSRPLALVVDDEPDICELLAITLDRMDIDADTCGDVRSARERLTQRDYQLCLTDMRLPDGDGLELLEWMQNQGPAHTMRGNHCARQRRNSGARLEARRL